MGQETVMSEPYLEVISFIEQLHRRFLEIVKLELDGLGIRDINNVQGMMLSNIGDAEMTVGELTLAGCYLGSNVSYNLKKLVVNGYLAHERSTYDRRSIHVKLTEKGRSLRERLGLMHQRHVEMLKERACRPVWTCNGSRLLRSEATDPCWHSYPSQAVNRFTHGLPHQIELDHRDQTVSDGEIMVLS